MKLFEFIKKIGFNKIKKNRIIPILMEGIPLDKDYSYWENSNRFEWVWTKIKELNLHNSRILDVGGATGNNILKLRYKCNVTTLDIIAGADIVCSADNIIADNESYDLVTCIDMLEHVDEELRLEIVNEMLRVAKNAVIIIAPQKTLDNILAEKLVLEYSCSKFIEQHLEYGLVDVNVIKSTLNKYLDNNIIKSYICDEIDDLRLWTILMTAGQVNLSEIYEKTKSLKEGKSYKRVCFLILK